MRIGINARFLLSHKMEGFGIYSHELLKRLVLLHPDKEFYFYFDRAFDPQFIYAKNIFPKVLFPPARHPFLWIWWFEYTLKKALRKDKIDLFWSLDGHACLQTDVPQIITIHDLNFVHRPKDLPFFVRWYYNHFFLKFARKAKHIITVSEFTKRDICKNYQINENDISTVWNGVSEKFHPIEQKPSNEIKNDTTKPYFLVVGSIHPRKNLSTVFQAFEEFTTYNETHELVIVGTDMWEGKQTVNIPSTILPRIRFMGHLKASKLHEMYSNAFALIFISHYEGFGLPAVEAMKSGIPVIASNTTSLPEIIGDAGILINPTNSNEVCAAMLHLIHNQTKYNELVQLGLIQSQKFSWDLAAHQISNILLK